MIGNRKNTGSDLRKVDSHRIANAEYDDAPELTDEQLARAVVTTGRSRGRPKAEKTKVSLTLRLDSDIVEAFKATGDGWQTKINEVLRSSLVKKSSTSHHLADVVYNATAGADWYVLRADGRAVTFEAKRTLSSNPEGAFVTKRFNAKPKKKPATTRDRTKHI